MNEVWEIVDARTGRPVSVSCYFTEEQALRQIAAWEERDRRGGRPDCSHLVGHMAAQQKYVDNPQPRGQSRTSKVSSEHTQPACQMSAFRQFQKLACVVMYHLLTQD